MKMVHIDLIEACQINKTIISSIKKMVPAKCWIVIYKKKSLGHTLFIFRISEIFLKKRSGLGIKVELRFHIFYI